MTTKIITTDEYPNYLEVPVYKIFRKILSYFFVQSCVILKT